MGEETLPYSDPPQQAAPGNRPEEGTLALEDGRVEAGMGLEGTMALPGDSSRMAEIEAAAEEEVEEWAIGDCIVDLYEVKEVFESGGFGKVYRVHHLEWQVDLAVKTLRKEFISDRLWKSQFIRECEGWVNLGLHPHIVTCHYVRDIGGLPRIFAEFMDGGSLADRIEEGMVDRLDIAVDLALQCIEGLSYAHNKGLVHRDIKPDNCLFNAGGVLKITDFGIASGFSSLSPGLMGEQGAAAPIRTMMVKGAVGTPAYMPPEQWDPSFGAIGPWTDIYAFGVMLFEMCTGERPFDEGGELPDILRMRHLQSAPPSPMELNGKIPPELSSIIGKCLAKKPAERFQHCGELREKLVEAYREITGAEYGKTPMQEVALRADGLNNRAVSLLDLGRTGEALALWEEALRIEPHHIESTFNRYLIMWRQYKADDRQIFMHLNGMRRMHTSEWLDDYLFAMMHVELGRLEELPAALESAEEAGAPKEKIRELKLIAERFTGSAKTITPPLLMSRQGHTEKVNAIFPFESPDQFASVSDDNTLCLWERSTGACTRMPCLPDGEKGKSRFLLSADGRVILRLRGFTGPFRLEQCREPGVKFVTLPKSGICTISADGSKIAVGDGEGVIEIYEPVSSSMLVRLEGHSGSIEDLAFSDDGTKILSRSSDRSVRLWNVQTGECTRTIQLGLDEVFSSAPTHDFRFMPALGKEKLTVWDLASGTPAYSLALPDAMGSLSGPGRICSISPEGQILLIVVGSECFLWDIIRRKILMQLTKPDHEIECAALSRNGQLLISAHRDGIRIWSAADGSCLELYEAGYRRDRPHAFSSDGRFEISVDSNDRDMLLRKMDGNEIVRRFKGHREHVICAALSPDMQCLISAGEDHTLRLWDAKAGDELWRSNEPLEFEGPVRRLPESGTAAVNREGTLVAVGGSGRMLGLWNCETGLLRAVFRHEKNMQPFFFSSDGKRIYCHDIDYMRVYCWEIQTGRCTGSFHCPGELRDSGMGERLFLAADRPRSADASLKLWDIVQGICVKTFDYRMRNSNNDTISSLSFSPETMRAATRHSDGTIRIWDADTGQCLLSLEAPGMEFSFCRFLPGGNQLLAGGCRELRLYDVRSGSCIRSFTAPADEEFKRYCLSGSGRWLITGSTFRVRLWEIRTGSCLGTFTTGIEISDMAVDDEARSLIISDTGANMRLLCPSTGEQKLVFGLGEVRNIVFSTDGKRAFASSRPGWKLPWDNLPLLGRVWNIRERRCKDATSFTSFMIQHHWATDATEGENHHLLGVSPDGRFILSWIMRRGRTSGRLRLIESSSGNQVRVLDHDNAQGYITALAFSSDSRLMATGGRDGVIRFWDIESGQCQALLKAHEGSVELLHLSDDCTRLISGGGDGALKVWDMEGRLVRKSFPKVPMILSEVRSVHDVMAVESRHERMLAYAGKAFDAGRHDEAIAMLEELRALPGFEFSGEALNLWNEVGSHGVRKGLRGGWVSSICQGDTLTSYDGRWLLTFEKKPSGEISARLVDAMTGKETGLFTMISPPWIFAVSPDRKELLTGHANYRLNAWEIESGRDMGSFMHQGTPYEFDYFEHLSISPDGNWVLVKPSRSHDMQIWQRQQRRLVTVSLPDLGLRGFDLTWLSSAGGLDLDHRPKLDGNRLVMTGKSSGAFTAIREFDRGDGVGVGRPGALSFDGRHVISGSENLFGIWDTQTGRLLHVLECASRVRKTGFTLDGRKAVVVEEMSPFHHRTYIWELDWEYEIPSSKAWDPNIRPLLEIFLTDRRQYAGSLRPGREISREDAIKALTRQGKPRWDDHDFDGLMQTLRYAGFGWISPAEVKKELDAAARDRDAEEASTTPPWKAPRPMKRSDAPVQPPSAHELTKEPAPVIAEAVATSRPQGSCMKGCLLIMGSLMALLLSLTVLGIYLGGLEQDNFKKGVVLTGKGAQSIRLERSASYIVYRDDMARGGEPRKVSLSIRPGDSKEELALVKPRTISKVAFKNINFTSCLQFTTGQGEDYTVEIKSMPADIRIMLVKSYSDNQLSGCLIPSLMLLGGCAAAMVLLVNGIRQIWRRGTKPA